ncbi:MAG: glycosyltransferase family 9 protein [Archangiaceae bacterium]|nr:glycosyltransferase family 9 protein [Archangiaceae bacterium]
MLKGLENVAKTALAIGATGLLWRPWRQLRAARRLERARRLALVRVDDRVGEALLVTPLVDALAGRYEVDVIVHQRCVRVLEGHPNIRRVHGLDRRLLALGAFAPGVSALRSERYDAVINCANWEVQSVTGALVSRLIAGAGVVVGPAVGAAGLLMDVAVPPLVGTQSEVRQRLRLLAPLGVEAGGARLSFRTPRPSQVLEPYLARARATPHAVVNPGGRVDWRRVPSRIFSAACRTLLDQGRVPIVTWGPGEEALAREVVAEAPGSELAPPTSLDDLAALMRACGLTVCNNTGPMHLSVAVGARTVALFLNMPSERWGYAEAPHRVVELAAADTIEAMIHQVSEALS